MKPSRWPAVLRCTAAPALCSHCSQPRCSTTPAGGKRVTWCSPRLQRFSSSPASWSFPSGKDDEARNYHFCDESLLLFFCLLCTYSSGWLGCICVNLLHQVSTGSWWRQRIIYSLSTNVALFNFPADFEPEPLCSGTTTIDTLCTVAAPVNGLFDGDCRWPLTGLCVPSLSLSCRIIHTTMVYPLSLYSTFIGYYFFNGLMCTLQLLHIFWAALIVRMVIKFLPGNVGTVAFTFPPPPCFHLSPSSPTNQSSRVFLQDIVEDERSDREETESEEDEGVDGKQKKKPTNGHMRNGHTPLNNNHSKRDWVDCKRLVGGLWRRDSGSHAIGPQTWEPKKVELVEREQHVQTNTNF